MILIAPWSSVLTLALAVEGGHEEAHHSLLGVIPKLLGIADLIPQPSRQPDLLLNTLLVFLIIIVLVFLTVRNLKRIPEGTLQNLFEMAVEGLNDFFLGIVGERGQKYIPFFASFFIYIFFMNMVGLLPGMQSPTADLNTTLGFAIIAVVSANLIGIREVGLGPYLMHFVGEPKWLFPLMCPLHIIGEVAKVISLAVRLFGNIFGEEMIILALMGLSPVILIGTLEVPFIPIQLPMMGFAIFSGTVQAMIFSVLTAVYVAQFLDHDHGEEHH